jgi:hypothetical protein
MASDKLTPSEAAILIALMAEASEVTNVELQTRWGIEVRKENREKLNELRYVKSRKPGRVYLHELDDKGWARVNDDLDVSSPRARAVGGALAALHQKLRDRVLPRIGYHSFAEMFSLTEIAPPQAPSNLEVRIRQAYAALASEPGAWVALARLRPFFGDVARADVDEALLRLSRIADVNIVPENNQKTLTDADVAAAVRIGDQDKHLLAIGV